MGEFPPALLTILENMGALLHTTGPMPGVMSSIGTVHHAEAFMQFRLRYAEPRIWIQALIDRAPACQAWRG